MPRTLPIAGHATPNRGSTSVSVERRRDEPAEREVADARALDALGRRAVLRVHVPDAAVEAAEHVEPERDLEVDRVVDRLARSRE